MPCKPGYCSGAMDCRDTSCCGHPINAIYRQYLDATENDASPTSPVDAMSWPYLLLLGVVTAVILGSACAWAITNWQLLELAALDFWN
jgi:hypothetical protein